MNSMHLLALSVFLSFFFPFLVNAQLCGNLGIQHVADIPATCGEMTMTMLHDQLGKPYLYIANKEGGLKIVDISELAQPLPVATVPLSELGNLDVINLHQSGQYLYLVLGNIFNEDQNPGLAIVDVSSPETPILLDIWIGTGLFGGAGVVRTEGNYAYLGAMQNGLIVFDISDKADIVQTSQFVPDITFPSPNPDPLKYNARGMAVNNDLVYLCYDAGGIRIIDVADKANPAQIGQYSNPLLNSLPRAYNNIVLDGSYAYATVDYCGLEVLDISDPAQISQAGWWNPWNCQSNPLNWFVSPGHTNEISFDDDCNLLFLSSGKSDLHILDISDPTEPDSCSFFGGANNEIGTWGVSTYDGQIFLSYICAIIPFSSNWTGVKILTYENNCVTGVSENTPPPIKSYPNPISSLLNVEISRQDNYEITVFNTLGQPIYFTKTLPQASPIQIDFSGHEDGIYYLSFYDGEKTSAQKVVKLRK